MLRIFLLFIVLSFTASEQILTISAGEKRVMNADKGGLIPLIVQPSEDVNEDIIFTCNSNIFYNFYYTTFGYDVKDENPSPKIPAGTKAGTEIKFNCVLIDPVYNEIITLVINEKFIKEIVPGGQYDTLIYYQNMKWIADENNNKIEFVPKFLINLSFNTSKNLEKNDKIFLDMILMEDIIAEIEIMNDTLYLNEENENVNTKINLIACTKIPKDTKKGNLIITCFVEEEAKNGNFTLKLNQGKKIDDIEPLVSGYIIFSEEGPNNEDLINQRNEGSTTKKRKANSQKLQSSLILIILLLLF